jgi:L-ascorbate metabolism protein UlaG (beta-lactamase superfamily)
MTCHLGKNVVVYSHRDMLKHIKTVLPLFLVCVIEKVKIKRDRYMKRRNELILSGEHSHVEMTRGSIFFVGTATVIIRYAGFTILTDPNFLHKGDHVHLGYGLKSRRVTEPAIELEQLPPLDFIVLSHLHEDHFDRLVEHRLDKTIPIITNPYAASALEKKGFTRVSGIETWEKFTVIKGDARVRISALPAKHAPTPLNYLLPPVMGSMLEFQHADEQTHFRLYISGDTLLYDFLREIPRHFPIIDLALMHLGGTKIMGVLLTMDARQGVQALQMIGPRTAIPVHYNDYTVFKSPLDDFKREVEAAGLAGIVRYLDIGETYEFVLTDQIGH